mmetsp:Transcript_2520/g.5497  ORF Transcript_2520/g.5497 Transcript_2520/m.5497 type:complete len:177 (-) Transcript_2520:148-678(-)
MVLRKIYEKQVERMREQATKKETRRAKVQEKLAAPTLRRIGAELQKEDAGVSVTRLRNLIEEARTGGISDSSIPIAERKVIRLEQERADAKDQLEALLRRRGEAASADDDADLLQRTVTALEFAREVGSEAYGRSRGSVESWRAQNATLRARELEELKTQRAREVRQKRRDRRMGL